MNILPTYTLEYYVRRTTNELKFFQADWTSAHSVEPENFPLNMSLGDWDEHFSLYNSSCGMKLSNGFTVMAKANEPSTHDVNLQNQRSKDYWTIIEEFFETKDRTKLRQLMHAFSYEPKPPTSEDNEPSNPSH